MREVGCREALLRKGLNGMAPPMTADAQWEVDSQGAHALIGNHNSHVRTAYAIINVPRFCHEKGYTMDTAQQIVTQVAHGDFAAVEQRLSDRLKPFLPVGTIQTTWQGLEQQFGAFQELGQTSSVQT